MKDQKDKDQLEKRVMIASDEAAEQAAVLGEAPPKRFGKGDTGPDERKEEPVERFERGKAEPKVGRVSGEKASDKPHRFGRGPKS